MMGILGIFLVAGIGNFGWDWLGVSSLQVVRGDNGSKSSPPYFAEELEKFLEIYEKKGKKEALKKGKKLGVITNEEQEKAFLEEDYIYLKVIHEEGPFGLNPSDLPPSARLSGIDLDHVLIKIKVNDVEELRKVKGVLYYIPVGVPTNKYVR